MKQNPRIVRNKKPTPFHLEMLEKYEAWMKTILSAGDANDGYRVEDLIAIPANEYYTFPTIPDQDTLILQIFIDFEEGGPSEMTGLFLREALEPGKYKLYTVINAFDGETSVVYNRAVGE